MVAPPGLPVVDVKVWDVCDVTLELRRRLVRRFVHFDDSYFFDVSFLDIIDVVSMVHGPVPLGLLVVTCDGKTDGLW